MEMFHLQDRLLGSEPGSIWTLQRSESSFGHWLAPMPICVLFIAFLNIQFELGEDCFFRVGTGTGTRSLERASIPGDDGDCRRVVGNPSTWRSSQM